MLDDNFPSIEELQVDPESLAGKQSPGDVLTRNQLRVSRFKTNDEPVMYRFDIDPPRELEDDDDGATCSGVLVSFFITPGDLSRALAGDSVSVKRRLQNVLSEEEREIQREVADEDDEVDDRELNSGLPFVESERDEFEDLLDS
jgi:hypothetical protein